MVLHRWKPLPCAVACDVPAVVSNAKPAAAREASARVLALAVSGKGAKHSRLLRARRAALVVVGFGTTKRRYTSERLLSFGARLWPDVPAAASNAKPAAT